jgi:hypothetical protein
VFSISISRQTGRNIRKFRPTRPESKLPKAVRGVLGGPTFTTTSKQTRRTALVLEWFPLHRKPGLDLSAKSRPPLASIGYPTKFSRNREHGLPVLNNSPRSHLDSERRADARALQQPFPHSASAERSCRLRAANMALTGSEDRYYVYENRLASFQGAQPVTKRRPSNASSRAPKALHWPHKSLSPVDVSRSSAP